MVNHKNSREFPMPFLAQADFKNTEILSLELQNDVNGININKWHAVLQYGPPFPLNEFKNFRATDYSGDISKIL